MFPNCLGYFILPDDMAHVASATSGSSDEPALPSPQPRLVRLNNIDRTQQQVRVLLSVVDMCQHLMVKDPEIGCTIDINPEAEKAAADTYALAQVRLRDLIDDQERWGKSDSQADVFTERLAKANLEVAEQQKINLDLLRRPSRIYSATVQKVPLQNSRIVWCAFLGSQPMNAALLGLGESPAAALAAFDEEFYRNVEQPPAEPPPAPPAPPATGKKQPRKKKCNG